MFTRSILLTFLFAASASLIDASALVWDQTEVRIEMEPDQEEARASFSVTNKGEKVVRIARVVSNCGCTGTILNKKIILPGESTEIIATFSKGKRQGLNRNRLQVYLDSQADAVVTLKMNVQIPTLIEARPQIVYWSPESRKPRARCAWQSMSAISTKSCRSTTTVHSSPLPKSPVIRKIMMPSSYPWNRRTSASSIAARSRSMVVVLMAEKLRRACMLLCNRSS